MLDHTKQTNQQPSTHERDESTTVRSNSFSGYAKVIVSIFLTIGFFIFLRKIGIFSDPRAEERPPEMKGDELEQSIPDVIDSNNHVSVGDNNKFVICNPYIVMPMLGDRVAYYGDDFGYRHVDNPPDCQVIDTSNPGSVREIQISAKSPETIVTVGFLAQQSYPNADDFVVVWGEGEDIYGQRHSNSYGFSIPQGPRFQINPSTERQQRFPSANQDSDNHDADSVKKTSSINSTLQHSATFFRVTAPEEVQENAAGSDEFQPPKLKP